MQISKFPDKKVDAQQRTRQHQQSFVEGRWTHLPNTLVDGATIHADDVAEPTTFESANKLSAQIPPEKIANPLTLKITVVNPDGTKFGPVDLIVSAGDGGDETEETSDQDESGDEQVIGDPQ